MSTIEDIVVDIKNGSDRKNELYTAIHKWLYRMCGRYLRFASDFGWEIDDLVSSLWVGVERSIKDFNPDKGYKFITYLKYHVSNTIHEFLGIRNGKPIHRPMSLDAELSEANELTLSDIREDRASADAFEKAEKTDYYFVLYNEIGNLPQIQSDTIKRHFLCNETLSEIASSRNVSRESVRQHERAALKALRNNKKLRDCYHEDFTYRHVSVTAFNNTRTSSTELAVLKTMDNMEQIKKLREFRADKK